VKTRGEEKNGLFANEVGQLLLELEMDVQRAVEETRPRAARAVFLDRLVDRAFDFGMVRQIEVDR
jgi:hypothetical protein